jgi:hypothetical protein
MKFLVTIIMAIAIALPGLVTAAPVTKKHKYEKGRKNHGWEVVNARDMSPHQCHVSVIPRLYVFTL